MQKSSMAPPFKLCKNECCVHPQADNNLGLCQKCYGPFYSSTIDPGNKRLTQRIITKYHQQMTQGCKSSNCRNPVLSFLLLFPSLPHAPPPLLSIAAAAKTLRSKTSPPIQPPAQPRASSLLRKVHCSPKPKQHDFTFALMLQPPKGGSLAPSCRIWATLLSGALRPFQRTRMM